MGGHNNDICKELFQKRKFGGMKAADKAKLLYKEYMEDPTAQYEMTFLEYKRLGKKGRLLRKRGKDN